jgi:predicted ATPase
LDETVLARATSWMLCDSYQTACKARSITPSSPGGGTKAVRRQSTGHPHNFAIALTLGLPDWSEAFYGFEVAARSDGGFMVKEESLRITSAQGRPVAHYRVREGEVQQSSQETMPPAVSDRLFLVVAAGLPEFRRAYDALTSMGFYNLNPQAMKELQSPDSGELLRRDGDNIASVVSRLAKEMPSEKLRCEQYLGKIVRGVVGMDRVQLGPRETIEFRQEVEGSSHPWRFHAANMSDGTLRAAGVLVAVSQLAHASSHIRLVGIEGT